VAEPIPPPFAVVGIGSNVHPERNVRLAVTMLAARLTVFATSSAWSTVPVGPPGQPGFVNAALLVGRWGDRSLRELLRQVEAQLGRRRTADRFAPRTLDLDEVLVVAAAAGADSTAVAAAADLLQQAHVAVPAAELLPDWAHPQTGETLSALAARLTEALPVTERPRRLAWSLRD
jgi:2-amino-4-hydroxy-6-hydroxymethyldihydropteridine diphosphokinase